MKFFSPKRKIAYKIYLSLAVILMIVQAIMSFINNGKENQTDTTNIKKGVNFQKQYEGIVVRKFYDNNNHAQETVELVLKNEDPFFLAPNPFDKSGFYEFVKTGDSIIKEDWGYKFRIKRGKIDTSFIIHPDYIDRN